jgi:bifunctional non-homologous end joining protein LigD
MEKSLAQGRVSFRLQGRKLKGGFALVRLKRGSKGNEWLMMKKKDADSEPGWKLKSEMNETRVARLKEKIPPCSSLS